MRLSVSKGTREARLSMVVTKHLPMRQPSGGAPVVVGGVNDVHMAKGCRMFRFGQQTGSTIERVLNERGRSPEKTLGTIEDTQAA